MPTSRIMAGRPNCCAAAVPQRLAATRPIIQVLLNARKTERGAKLFPIIPILRTAPFALLLLISLTCISFRFCLRLRSWLSPRQDVAHVIVRREPLLGEHVDGSI